MCLATDRPYDTNALTTLQEHNHIYSIQWRDSLFLKREAASSLLSSKTNIKGTGVNPRYLRALTHYLLGLAHHQYIKLTWNFGDRLIILFLRTYLLCWIHSLSQYLKCAYNTNRRIFQFNSTNWPDWFITGCQATFIPGYPADFIPSPVSPVWGDCSRRLHSTMIRTLLYLYKEV